MTTSDPPDERLAFAGIFEVIVAQLMPLFLPGAHGDRNVARLAILESIASYDAVTPPELICVGIIISFGAVANDMLRLSMTPGLSDNGIIQYRKSAIALNRTATRCQANLSAMRQRRAKATQRQALHDIAAQPVERPRPVDHPALPVPTHDVTHGAAGPTLH